jgi:hypothetical protein
MKILVVAFSLAFLAGCNTDDNARRDDHKQTPGEAVGKATYEIQKDAKKAAKEISKDLKSFGRDAKEGYQQQKQKDGTGKQPRDGDGASK